MRLTILSAIGICGFVRLFEAPSLPLGGQALAYISWLDLHCQFVLISRIFLPPPPPPPQANNLNRPIDVWLYYYTFFLGSKHKSQWEYHNVL
jgi:hypothetical protein